MSNAKLYFLCGLPRSGKSTYCQEWLNEQHKLKRLAVVVSGDAFRKALHGHEFLPIAESYVFAAMDTAIRALLLTGFNVLVDETSTTEETILRYLRIDIDATPIIINTPSHVCICRAKQTDKPFLVEPIKRMSGQMKKLMANWPETFERLKETVRSRQTQDVEI